METVVTDNLIKSKIGKGKSMFELYHFTYYAICSDYIENAKQNANTIWDQSFSAAYNDTEKPTYCEH